MTARLSSQPGGVDGEQAGWEASEAGGRAAPDVVPDGGVSTVADLQELGRAAAAVRGVSEEDLVPQALVTVEQGEPGAGARAFAAHDDAGAGRVVAQVDHAGQLADLARKARRCVRNAFALPALSVRTRMSVPCRWASGICARAWSSTVM